MRVGMGLEKDVLRNKNRLLRRRITVIATALLIGGCTGVSGFFSPQFTNTFIGGVFPVTPGPVAPFILVRVLNETGQTAEFVVTHEQRVIERDEDGNFLFDDSGNPITSIVRKTSRLTTFPISPANDVGILLDCSQFPITRIGLGESLSSTDSAVFIAGGGPAGTTGFGITAGDLNPLLLEEGNFNCGDTVIFQAFQSVNAAGGVGLLSFVLPDAGQPGVFGGPSTFENFQAVQESLVREEEP